MKKYFGIISSYLLAIGVAVLTVFPLIWMGIAGFKTEAEVMAIPFRFFPQKWVCDNYVKLIQDGIFFRSIVVTFLVAISAALISTIINSMAAYVFARIEFPFKKILWFYVAMTIFIPNISMWVPQFVVVSRLQMLNTVWVLLLPGLVWAYCIFFIRQFFLSIPVSLEESALIDGASRFKIYTYIFIPMSKPPLLIMGVGTFLGYWNSFIWPIMTISDERLFQVMQVIAYFRSVHLNQWGKIMAASSIAALPTIILFLIFQRYIVEGIRISGLK